MMNTSKKNGFTLVELLAVIVLLGIIATIAATGVFNTGAIHQATAQLIYGTGNNIVNSWRDIVRGSRTSANPQTGIFFENAAHDALDVLVQGGIAVSSTFDNWYLNFGPARNTSIITLTAPTATTAGVYAIKQDMVITISAYVAASRQISIQFTNVPTETVEVLKEQYEPNVAFDATAADTAGVIQHTVAANDVHTLTIIYSL